MFICNKKAINFTLLSKMYLEVKTDVQLNCNQSSRYKHIKNSED